jgi:peptidoglycan/LPS O-acetylase OafA/YrhL
MLVLWHHIGVTLYQTPAIAIPSWLAWLQWLASDGFIGLHLFFVLSGFLLFLPYARALAGAGAWPSWQHFYARRASRILPAYLVVLVPLLALLIAQHALLVQLINVVLLLALCHNLALSSWSLTLTYDGPLWSLATEWQYYLVLPLLALLVSRVHGRRGHVLAILALMGAALGARALALILHSALRWPDPVLPILYNVRGTYLEEFAVGMLVAVVWSAQSWWARRIAAWAGWSVPVGLLGLVGCTFWAMAAGRVPFAGTPDVFWANWTWPRSASYMVLGEWATSLCCAVLLVSGLPALQATGGVGRWAARWQYLWTRPWLRQLGTISYGIYLWHSLVLKVVAEPLAMRLPGQAVAWRYVALVAIAVGGSLIAGFLSYRYVERPFLSHRGSVRTQEHGVGLVLADGTRRPAGAG